MRRSEFSFGKNFGLTFIYVNILTNLKINSMLNKMVTTYYKDKINYQPYWANMLLRIGYQLLKTVEPFHLKLFFGGIKLAILIKKKKKWTEIPGRISK